VIRCNEDGEVMSYNCFAPLAIAMIGKPPETVYGRAIECRTFCRKDGEQIKPFRTDRADDLHILARKMARWAADHADEIKNMYPHIGALQNTTNWRPLFAIAEVAGGVWPARARDVAAKAHAAQADQSQCVELLADIKAVSDARKTDALFSEDLVQCLNDQTTARGPRSVTASHRCNASWRIYWPRLISA
jgi:hypothetical protein